MARSWEWSAEQITIQRLMTHAEAASNHDGGESLAAELLERYELTLVVVPPYREDALQASVGWTLFELTLEQASAPVILRGISVSFKPFRLGERRRGDGVSDSVGFNLHIIFSLNNSLVHLSSTEYLPPYDPSARSFANQTQIHPQASARHLGPFG